MTEIVRTGDQPASVTRLLFVGAGVMGAPMIRNLHKAGFAPVAFDTRADVLEDLAGEGIATTAEAAKAAGEADVIITMLPDTPDVRGVLMGEDGLGAAMKPGGLIVDMSTISATAVKEMAEALAARSIALLDAPVSGGMKGAIAGTLSIMVGGTAEAFAQAQSVLQAMGTTIRHRREGIGAAATRCTGAIHWYPVCGRVSKKRGFLASSVKTLRRVLIKRFKLCSLTAVSPQIAWMSCSRASPAVVFTQP